MFSLGLKCLSRHRKSPARLEATITTTEDEESYMSTAKTASATTPTAKNSKSFPRNYQRAQQQQQQQHHQPRERKPANKVTVSVEASAWKRKLEESVKDVEEWNLEQKQNYKKQVRF